ncbi:hypothetical protein OG21DRAFT_371746 [Imleria badia]|nr:hypothetical protein OG21DRAFT_371746 [Imleria badia]
MSNVSTHLKDLKVGDLIYTEIKIDIKDLADPNSKTKTTKAIKAGKEVKRICIVLVPGHDSVEVSYSATFHDSHTLPAHLDKHMWYPFKPATKEGDLEPLPERRDERACWASLRALHKITKNPVDKLDEEISAASAHLIKEKMK